MVWIPLKLFEPTAPAVYAKTPHLFLQAPLSSMLAPAAIRENTYFRTVNSPIMGALGNAGRSRRLRGDRSARRRMAVA